MALRVFGVIFSLLLPMLTFAADIPQDDEGAQSLDQSECVQITTNNCIDNECLNSEDINCQDKCQEEAQDKCQQTNEE